MVMAGEAGSQGPSGRRSRPRPPQPIVFHNQGHASTPPLPGRLSARHRQPNQRHDVTVLTSQIDLESPTRRDHVGKGDVLMVIEIEQVSAD